MNSMELEGKEILTLLWMKDYFYLCLDDGSDLQISNHNAFWRLIQNEKILISSSVFFAHSSQSFGGPDYWPDGITETASDWCDEQDLEEYIDSLFEQLEQASDENVKEMMRLLEYTAIQNVVFGAFGDLKLTLSNGVILEICATSALQDKNHFAYKLRTE